MPRPRVGVPPRDRSAGAGSQPWALPVLPSPQEEGRTDRLQGTGRSPRRSPCLPGTVPPSHPGDHTKGPHREARERRRERNGSGCGAPLCRSHGSRVSEARMLPPSLARCPSAPGPPPLLAPLAACSFPEAQPGSPASSASHPPGIAQKPGVLTAPPAACAPPRATPRSRDRPLTTTPTLRTRPHPGHEGCGGELGRVALSTG